MVNRRKFALGDIAKTTDDGRYCVVVEWKQRHETSMYRVIPMDGKWRRYGRAKWVVAHFLETTGLHSNTGSLKVYRANERMDRDVGRGCDCHCCLHVSLDKQDFSNRGEWKHDGQD